MPLRRLLALLAVTGLAGCGTQQDRSEPPSTSELEPAPQEERAEPVRAEDGFEVEVLATGLEVPWDVTFLPDGSALVTEREGRVRRVSPDGRVADAPVARVEVRARGEGGLLGIDLDPAFREGSRFAYLYVTTADGMEVQRWHVGEEGRELTLDEVVLDGIRAGPIHDSGRLRFGPDGFLYVLTGDAGRPELAQDRGSLNGKVLRLSPDEYRESTDRPEIVSIGHRNPQGLDWQPGSGRLFASEHGPACCDEVNWIREGRDYAWPQFGDDQVGPAEPEKLWEETIAPSGAAFVSLPGSSWTGDMLVAALAGTELHRLTFDGEEITGDQALLEDEYGRLRAVVEAPDGSLWVTTSNRDGRGDPVAADDRILRLVPPAG